MTKQHVIDTSILLALEDFLGKGRVLCNEPLTKHSSFEIGGPAQYLVYPESVREIAGLLTLCKEKNLRWIVIGKGSDLLFLDEGYEGLIIKLTEAFSQTKVDDTYIWAQAGISLESLSQLAQQKGLSGLEFACGIPGTLGGGLYMNAGAYGGQLSDVVEQVRLITPEGKIELLNLAGQDFGYRLSPIPAYNGIVLDARLRLNKKDPAEIQMQMDDLQERRRSKQPLEFPSGGSAFKRPEGHYASALIDDAGLKGHTIGGAAVSEKHAGFIVNINQAKATDVLALVKHVQDKVEDCFDVSLEPELRIVPVHGQQKDLNH